MPIGRIYSPEQPSPIRSSERGRPRARHAAAASFPQNQSHGTANPKEISGAELPSSAAAAAASSESADDLEPGSSNLDGLEVSSS